MLNVKQRQARKQGGSVKARVRRDGPPQRKLGPGRPCKINQVDTATLIADVAAGVPVTIACAAVGINRDTFYQWIDQHPDFSKRLAAEKQRVILEAINVIKSCSTKDREFRNWSWFLETVYRDHFAPPDKGPLFAQNVFTISIEKAREIEATRTQLLPEVNAILGLTEAKPTSNGDNDGA